MYIYLKGKKETVWFTSLCILFPKGRNVNVVPGKQLCPSLQEQLPRTES